MGRVWSDENKFQKWLEVELAAAETLAETGIVPREAALKLRERGRADVTRINELEAKVRHDVIAFTMAVQESVGDPEAARWLHYGLTSNDVVDTAQALLVREASQQIEKALERMGEVLEQRAWEFKDTPQIGRTHGVHAEPITFGLKIANWFSENRRDLARFQVAARQMAVGKISGAVGTCTHLGPEIEEKICARLGLATAPITSQVIERDRHAQYLSTLAIVAGGLERIAQEVRHLQRTEVREVEEPFGGEQRGSSAMPHKRNPVSSEQVCGLARVVRASSRLRSKISRCGTSATFRTGGGTGDSAGFDDSHRLHAASHHGNRGEYEGVSRAHAAESGCDEGSRVFGAAAAGSCGAWRAARRCLQMGAGACDGGVGFGDEFQRSRRIGLEYSQVFDRKALRIRLTCRGSCALWMRFSGVCSGRKLLSRCNPARGTADFIPSAIDLA